MPQGSLGQLYRAGELVLSQPGVHAAGFVEQVEVAVAVHPFRVHEVEGVGPEARIGVISKLYPSRSHTGAAQGGVCAALGNTEEDNWEWHWFDTVKGGDYLVDQDAAEVMCHDAVETVINLEHLGLPFNRTPEGLIDQRRFGGHTRNYGEGPVRRACYAADRTGHHILQTLYEQCIRHDVAFYDEYQVLDLAMPAGADGPVSGVIALQLSSGEIHSFRAKAVLFATGGFGKMFKVTSNAHTLTGDGVAIAYRRGLPLEDMEFFQFHPTGMYKLGFLLSEAMRGEGGFLVNGKGERFMERYAPTMKDLASRDVVSRSIYQEIAAGRGIDGKDFVHLDVRHLGAKVLNEKLPDMSGFIRTYFGLDPLTELVPIQPTAHYAMGGIPTDVDGRVLADEAGRRVPGFYAAGECACVSVHGANRLGTNSLLDILVFGRRAGIAMADEVRRAPHAGARRRPPRHRSPTELEELLSRTEGERPAVIREELQETMFAKCGVYRIGRAAGAGVGRGRRPADPRAPAGRPGQGAAATTPTSARRSSWASCSTAPRPPWPRPWPAPRVAARTRARTTPIATTSTG